MEALQSMLIAINNGDYDHIGDSTRARARGELMELIGCDSADLNELFLQFVNVEAEVKIIFR